MTVLEQIAHVLRAESAAIASVPVTEAFGQAVHEIANCDGKVVTMGMGKAGLIAQKMAATLCATGTPAVFLHPGEAAHGDLGVLTNRDLLLAYSTSGKTAEVLEAIASARHIGVETIIGITSHPDAPLRALVDLVLDMGVVEEPCPLGLTPSASSAVMSAISDAIALTAASVLGFTREDFAVRHRGGYLGAQVHSILATPNG
jgi:arabinose-5-phosphate isomerase